MLSRGEGSSNRKVIFQNIQGSSVAEKVTHNNRGVISVSNYIAASEQTAQVTAITPASKVNVVNKKPNFNEILQQLQLAAEQERLIRNSQVFSVPRCGQVDLPRVSIESKVYNTEMDGEANHSSFFCSRYQSKDQSVANSAPGKITHTRVNHDFQHILSQAMQATTSDSTEDKYSPIRFKKAVSHQKEELLSLLESIRSTRRNQKLLSTTQRHSIAPKGTGKAQPIIQAPESQGPTIHSRQQTNYLHRRVISTRYQQPEAVTQSTATKPRIVIQSPKSGSQDDREGFSALKISRVPVKEKKLVQTKPSFTSISDFRVIGLVPSKPPMQVNEGTSANFRDTLGTERNDVCAAYFTSGQVRSSLSGCSGKVYQVNDQKSFWISML